MLVIKILNDETGNAYVGNYKCEVCVTISPTELRTIATAYVRDHVRSEGWQRLVQKLLLEAEPTEICEPTKHHWQYYTTVMTGYIEQCEVCLKLRKV